MRKFLTLMAKLTVIVVAILAATGREEAGAIRPSPSPATFGAGAEVVLSIDGEHVVREVPPGVVGWGAMWKRGILWPPPPNDLTDETPRRLH